MIIRQSSRLYSTATASTPHPALTLLRSFFSPTEQRTLLSHSLKLLQSPSRSTSNSRKLQKKYLKSNPEYDIERDGFMRDEGYEFEGRHFDGVIEHYREMVVRDSLFPQNDDLIRSLRRFYDLLPPSSSSNSPDPPSHTILHLLHLSSHGQIYPHVDNLEASGGTIISASLGGERIVRFDKTDENGVWEDEVESFEVVVKPGDVYIQKDPLRTHYKHSIPRVANWEGREVGGTQRLSLMLRDRLENER